MRSLRLCVGLFAALGCVASSVSSRAQSSNLLLYISGGAAMTDVTGGQSMTGFPDPFLGLDAVPLTANLRVELASNPGNVYPLAGRFIYWDTAWRAAAASSLYGTLGTTIQVDTLNERATVQWLFRYSTPADIATVHVEKTGVQLVGTQLCPVFTETFSVRSYFSNIDTFKVSGTIVSGQNGTVWFP